MIFTSLDFIIFFIIVYIIYWIANKKQFLLLSVLINLGMLATFKYLLDIKKDVI